MKKFLPGILVVLLCVGSAVAAPYAGYLYPAGMQAGTTVRVSGSLYLAR